MHSQKLKPIRFTEGFTCTKQEEQLAEVFPEGRKQGDKFIESILEMGPLYKKNTNSPLVDYKEYYSVMQGYHKFKKGEKLPKPYSYYNDDEKSESSEFQSEAETSDAGDAHECLSDA